MLECRKEVQLSDIYVKGRFDIEKLLSFFQREGQLKKEILLGMIKKTIHILEMEPNLIERQWPCWIVGDIHGQFHDFAQLITKKLDVYKDTIIFLGDYVDRGYFSIEVMIVLMAMKLNRPKFIVLLRGNHESRQMTSYYNFKQECLKKYDQEIYQAFIDLFYHLPLAILINKAFLCLHGGISEHFQTLNQMNRIERAFDTPDSGLFCDILWADPTKQPYGRLNTLTQENRQRGCSFIFGKELTDSFLQRNKLSCIIRGHQAQENGYKLFNWKGQKNFPSIITIFSAPNYCDFYNNHGACIFLDKGQLNIEQYKQVNHPYILPNFMNLFQWTIPFVTEKVTEMMHFLLQPHKNIEINESNDINLVIKYNIIKKLLADIRLKANTNYKLSNLKGRSLDNLLASDEEALSYIKNYSKEDQNFQAKRSIDLKHEKRPTTIESKILLD